MDEEMEKNMKLTIFGWKRTKKLLFLFLFVFSVLLWGMMTNIEYYNQQLSRNNIKFDSVKSIYEIVPGQLNPSVRYNVTNIKNIVLETRPRVVTIDEKRLFRKNELDIIVKLQRNNWKTWKNKFCYGNMLNFQGLFLLMKDIVIDPSKTQSKAKGGEELNSVIGHTERDEDVKVKNGFLNLRCEETPEITFSRNSHFQDWLSKISFNPIKKESKMQESSFAVLIKRGDYANLYWTLIELYNTYLTIRLFDEDPKTTDVILIDAHPAGKLDNLWTLLFRNVYRIRHLSDQIFCKKLAWVIPTGPMPLSVKTIPFLEDFKLAIYRGIRNSVSKYHECSNYSTIQNVTFILRKDYVAHPRNPKGNIQRKISNEKQLISYLTEKIPEVHIHAVQIDLLPIKKQVELIYNTNILIGVHGAGLGHTLLLRSGSAMIELFPSSYKRSPNPHFQMFAYWADVHYDRWYSPKPKVANNEWLYVDPVVTYNLIKHALTRTCTLKSK